MSQITYFYRSDDLSSSLSRGSMSLVLWWNLFPFLFRVPCGPFHSGQNEKKSPKDPNSFVSFFFRLSSPVSLLTEGGPITRSFLWFPEFVPLFYALFTVLSINYCLFWWHSFVRVCKSDVYTKVPLNVWHLCLKKIKIFTLI